jgi:hypothetical protein
MIIKMAEYISLLYFANQLGKKISKLSLVEFEYLRAITVTGHILLQMIKIRPSINMAPTQIQTHLSILSLITA